MQHLVPILLAVCAALLIFAAFHDIGFRTVPDCVPVLLLAAGVSLRVSDHNILAGLTSGGVVFCLTLACWWFGWMGGADVKLLAASAVLVPPSAVPAMVLATSLAGGILAVFYIAASRLLRRRHPAAASRSPALARPQSLLARAARCEVRRLRRCGPLPYAVAIASGALLSMSFP